MLVYLSDPNGPSVGVLRGISMITRHAIAGISLLPICTTIRAKRPAALAAADAIEREGVEPEVRVATTDVKVFFWIVASEMTTGMSGNVVFIPCS